MNFIAKNKNKKTKMPLVVLFLVFLMIFNFIADPVLADTASQQQTLDAANKTAATGGSVFGGQGSAAQATSTLQGTDYYKEGNHGAYKGNGQMQYAQPTGQNTADSCLSLTSPSSWVRCPLIGVFNLSGWLFGIAATAFEWVVRPENISGTNGVLNKQAIKDVWIMVRDLLNLGFILVLLFSAFCTIFQVDSWGVKKVWLNILINALLVNFSYPIARIIIDISNVAFYYFVNNLFTATGTVTGSGIFAMFGAGSNMAAILMPKGYNEYEISYIIAMTIVVFIMGMTLLVVAALFFVRIIALMLLVMFSPIGFVGYIFPDTKKYADKWWDQLISYSFFAPIMIFFINITIRITQAVGNENWNSFAQSAQTNVNKSSGVEPGWIGHVAFLLIPVILMWMGMGIAQKFGIEGASLVTKKVQGWGKGFASWMIKTPWQGTGIPGSYKKAKDDFSKKGKLFGKKIPLMGTEDREKREARWAAYVNGGKGGYGAHMSNANAEEVKKIIDKKDTSNMTEEDLEKLKESSNKFEKAAAILELAARGKADSKDVISMREGFGDNSKVFNQIRNKVKTYDPAAAFASNVNPTTGEVISFDQARMKEFINSNQFDSKKLNASSVKNAEFMEMAFKEGGLKPKDIEELRGKSGNHQKNLESSIGKMLDSGSYSNLTTGTKEEKELARNIQMSFLAQTGKFHSSMSGMSKVNSRKEMLQRSDKDILKRLDSAQVTPELVREIVTHVKPGKFKDILLNMDNEDAARQINRYARAYTPSAMGVVNKNASEIEKLYKTDPVLRRFT